MCTAADYKTKPKVAAKDSNNPALKQEKGFHKRSSSNAAAKAVNESRSSLSQKETAQNSSKTVALITDGENPTRRL